MTDQPTLSEATDPGPEIGITLDERTHYAHVRYAASETAGVIWYDPRDGREKFSTGETGADLEDVGDECLTSVRVHPFRPGSHGDPGERYFVEQNVTRKERHNADRDGYEEYVITGSYGRTEVFDSLADARQWCRENIDGYADAEYRDAVAERTGDDDR